MKNEKTSRNPAEGTSDPRERAMVNEFHKMPKLLRRLLGLAIVHPELDVYSFTLTRPRWARTDHFFKAGHWFARQLRDDELIVLFADKGDTGNPIDRTPGQGHLHFHGIAFLDRSPRPGFRGRELLAKWVKRMKASPKANQAWLIRNQNRDRSGEAFETDFGTWLEYCCKREEKLNLTLPERVIATGAAEKAIKELFGTGSVDPCFLLQVQNGIVRPVTPTCLPKARAKAESDDYDAERHRLCRDCKEPLPKEYRSNKWYHDNGKCSRKHRFDRRKREEKAKKTVVPTKYSRRAS